MGIGPSAEQVEFDCRARAVGVSLRAGASIQDKTAEEERQRGLHDEVLRREALPPMRVCCVFTDTQESLSLAVRAWEQIGASVRRELGVYRVDTISFAGEAVEPLTTRWLDLDVEEDAVIFVSWTPAFTGVLEDHNTSVVALADLGDGRLASSSKGGNINLWSHEEGGLKWVLRRDCNPMILPAGEANMHVLLYALAHCTAMVHMGKGMLACGFSNGKVGLWNADSGGFERHLSGCHNGEICAMVRLGGKDGRFATASKDRVLKIWDAQEERCLQEIDLGEASVVTNSATGRCEGVYLGHSGGNGSSGTKSGPFGGRRTPGELLTSMVALDGGRRVATGSMDKTVRLWDIETELCRGVLEGHTGAVTCLVVLARLDNDTLMHAHNEEEAEEAPNAAAATWDELLASGSRDTTIRIWRVAKRECLRLLQAHEGSVVSLARLHDGRLASSSQDDTIRVWDVASGGSEVVAEASPGSDTVITLAALGYGRLAAGSLEGPIRIWGLGEVDQESLAERTGRVLDADLERVSFSMESP